MSYFAVEGQTQIFFSRSLCSPEFYRLCSKANKRSHCSTCYAYYGPQNYWIIHKNTYLLFLELRITICTNFDATDKERIKPLSDYPLSEDELEFAMLQYNDLHADLKSAESAYAEFAQFMLKTPDLYEVREVDKILRLFHIRLPRID